MSSSCLSPDRPLELETIEDDVSNSGRGQHRAVI